MNGFYDMRGPRFPLAALVAALAMSPRAIAEHAGFSARAAHRWRLHGLTVAVADHVAVAHGLHPMNVWGDAWMVDTEEAAA